MMEGANHTQLNVGIHHGVVILIRDKRGHNVIYESY